MEREARYPDYIGISDVNTKSFEQMRVEGYFDGQPSIMFDEPEGFDIGDPPDLHLQPKYEQINFDLYVKTREKTERVQDLARETDRRCPQIGLFRMAGVPMMMSWYRGGVEKAVVRRQISYWTGQDSGGRINREAEENRRNVSVRIERFP